MTEQRPLTKVYQALEAKLKGFKAREEYLKILENPPYLEDCMTSIDSYLLKVRELQTIVKEKVNLSLTITECEGHNSEHLFDTDLASVSREFSNWGLGSLHENILFINTGHQWTTVESAKFKSKYDSIGNKKNLENLKEKRSLLREEYRPVDLFYNLFLEYDKTLFHLCQVFECKELEEERKLMKEIEKKFLSKTNFIRKGVLSLSFVNSMIYQLEQSLDLSKNHPGD